MKDKKIALVSGANRGIGKEILIALGKSDYNVIGTSRSEEGVSLINQTIKENNFGGAVNQKAVDEELIWSRLHRQYLEEKLWLIRIS